MIWNQCSLRLFSATGFVFAALVVCAPATAQDQVEQAIDRFVSHVDAQTDLSEAIREEAKQVIAELRSDDYSRRDCLIEGLCVLYPEFESALIALGEERVVEAIASLSDMITSEDTYLAAHARYFTARTFMIQERYEAALMMLIFSVSDEGNHLLTGGESQFLQGVCYAGLLRRDEAQSAFDKFLQEYPDAPERLRVGAWRQKEQLAALNEGSLQDVQQRMEYVRRRLGLEDTSGQTQGHQQEIIDMLALLIEEAEGS